MDPCEGIVDKPKVYDHGWKKKLNYVIATSVYEVQDVTKRYVIDHEDLKKRRSWVKDDWLNRLVMDQTDGWQKNLSNDLKTKLAQMRWVFENYTIIDVSFIEAKAMWVISISCILIYTSG